MWSQVEQELTKLLSTKPFPALMGVPAYAKLFQNGKLDAKACKEQADFIVNKTDLKSGIREFGSREPLKVQEWSKPIWRAIDPKRRTDGYWWFDDELVQRWSGVYPPGTPDRQAKIMKALRPMLAVCTDWNDFTILRTMRISSPIPVITGQGAHKGLFSSDSKDPEAQELHEKTKNVFLIGGYKQFFVPFVNGSWTSEVHL